MFGARKEVAEPDVRVASPELDPELRDETDPDPLIEEMVARLRQGLTSLVAVDEWGRPLAWRNVVRLALGPLASKLRDTEQALELAVSMIPPTAEAAATVAEVTAELEELAAAAETTDKAAEAEHVPWTEAAAESHATVEVILPLSQAAPETPVAPDVAGHAILREEPLEVAQPSSPAAEAPEGAAEGITPAPGVPGATSMFVRSGDQRSVTVRALSPRELLGGGGPHDATSTKHDRFLAGLHGEGQQVRRDEDRRAGGSGLGNDF